MGTRRLVAKVQLEAAMNYTKTAKHSWGQASNDRLSDGGSGDHAIGKGERQWERSRLAPPLAGLNERSRSGMGRTRKT